MISKGAFTKIVLFYASLGMACELMEKGGGALNCSSVKYLSCMNFVFTEWYLYLPVHVKRP